MIRTLTLSGALALVLTACTTASAPEAQAPVPKPPAPEAQAPVPKPPAFAKFDIGPAYMTQPLPDGRSLAPPPPEPGSPAQARDDAASAAGLALQGTERFALAARDADLSTGAVGRAFQCTVKVAISDANTPAIAHLLRRSTADFGLSTSGVKKRFQRERPFMGNHRAICTPDDDKLLRADGSYPSGHSAIGFGAALVLSAVFPDRAGELTARGRAFADSRRVCNVHWLSDTEMGELFAAATFARLQSDATFRADLARAQAEAKTLANAPMPSAESCATEAVALVEE